MLTTIIKNCISKFLAASGSERETHLQACNYNASEETWFRFINPLLLLFLSRKCKSKNPHLKSPLLKLEHDHHFTSHAAFSLNRAVSFFIERRCIRKPWYFCLRFPHSTRLRFRTHFRILTLLHQIRFWNQESCNRLLDQQWFRFELPRLFDLGKNLLKIFHGCVFLFLFFRRDPVTASRKLINDVFPFFCASCFA